MGIDAPSQDLTARIAQRRKQLIRDGIVDPMKPGEHVIAGRGGGRTEVDEAALSRADMAARYRGRSRGAEGGDEVVEMDYADYTGTQPGSREAADADEPFEVGEDEQPDGEFNLDDFAVDDDPPPFLPEPEEGDIPPLRRRRPAPIAPRSHDTDEILKGQEDLRERIDGIAAGMLALAEGIGAALARIEHPLMVIEAPPVEETLDPEDTPFEMPTIVCRLCGREDEHRICVPPWVRRLFGLR